MSPRQETREGTARPARVLGILAGGLALGMASAVTVAAWHDPEAATATFTAGTFETQSQAAGTGWAHHGPGDPATLAADLTGLAPGGTYEAPTAGESHYGWLNLRTASGSTRGGQVLLEDVSADGALAGVLEYRVVAREASTAQCTATDFSAGATYLAGGPDSYLGVGSGTDGVSTEIGADSQDALGLCLDLRVAAPGDGDAGKDVQGTGSQVGLSVSASQL
ncbi:SipW-dependent-type signal peptide-containing protein [Brachybacterium sacelli]|uniref:Ribosomally synthesized peptide with SipW-like signal peptide n=1 Tax=Brachybacterium sacelli TaxID=173364 RepID=A0ABS4WXA3_9MICO|nr:SipW-dependent-type signal peptide-containing protein [Brachybacterium sacelli]MBP2380832.1 putative ribosomally synthesized peptide with SipW-like signal peptide [Brachybacterium sacelli]